MADRPAPTDAVDTVVFVHGLWMTPLSWEGWMERFSGYGFEVLAPAWPKVEGTPEEIRNDPSRIAGVGIAEILDSYEATIRGLDKPPIIIGHSFGGGFTEVLLDRGLGAAGVAISPASPRGVLALAFSTLKSGFSILKNPANRNKGVPFSPEQFHYAFCNTLSDEESRRFYDRYAIPGVGRVLFEGVKANMSKKTPFQLDWAKSDRAPLLITGATEDHVVPAKVARANHRKYAKSSAVTDYKEYEGRTHFTAGMDGWEATADDALAWAMAQVKAA
jgi:alpha-beta hydrolase superfamily lysophospholipase